MKILKGSVTLLVVSRIAEIEIHCIWAIFGKLHFIVFSYANDKQYVLCLDNNYLF